MKSVCTIKHAGRCRKVTFHLCAFGDDSSLGGGWFPRRLVGWWGTTDAKEFGSLFTWRRKFCDSTPTPSLSPNLRLVASRSVATPRLWSCTSHANPQHFKQLPIRACCDHNPNPHLPDPRIPAIDLSIIPTPTLLAASKQYNFARPISASKFTIAPSMATDASTKRAVKEQLVDKLPKRFKGIKFGIQ